MVKGMCLRLTAWILTTFLFSYNEASLELEGTRTRLKSKAEIQASMTRDVALRTVLSLNQTRARPRVLALIETALGQSTKRRLLRGAESRKIQQDDEFEADDQDDGDEAASGQTPIKTSSKSQVAAKLGKFVQTHSKLSKADVTAARIELSKMLFDSSTALEFEETECKDFKRTRLDNMRQLRIEITYLNSRASYARSLVLQAENMISTIRIQVQKLEEQQKAIKKQCETEILNMKSQLTITKRDMVVMGGILTMTECKSSIKVMYKTQFLQCPHCAEPFVIPRGDVQSLLRQLQSEGIQQRVQNHLNASWQVFAKKNKPVFLSEEQVKQIRSQMNQEPLVRDVVPAGAVDTPQIPMTVVPQDCAPSTKCVLTTENCQILLDRFLALQAGLDEKKTELEQAIYTKETWCEETDHDFSSQITTLEIENGQQNENLAKAEDLQQTSQSASWSKSGEHRSILGDYGTKMDSCCQNQNTLQSEICALDKIRGELGKLSNSPDYVVDCEVSEWTETECSKSCGGGKVQKNRNVLVQAAHNGMGCLPLEAEEDCNTQLCPIDCVLEEWGGWSACTAECGGGVRSRGRIIKTEPANDGRACEALSESEQCNAQDCNADCELSDWGDWGPCSKACGDGLQRREKSVDKHEIGEGFCADPEDASRMEFKPCNEFSCNAYLGPGEKYLKCNANLDIMIMIDGSATLGEEGYKAVKEAVTKFTSLKTDRVNIAIQIFGGPHSFEDYKSCTGNAPNINIETMCGVKWLTHLNTVGPNYADLLSKEGWPGSTTLMQVGFAEAKAELINGRPRSNTAVLVFTDGLPLAHNQTVQAAERLREKAQIMMVGIGLGAPRDFLRKLVNVPREDHVMLVQDAKDLMKPVVMNKIMSTVCSTLGQ